MLINDIYLLRIIVEGGIRQVSQDGGRAGWQEETTAIVDSKTASRNIKEHSEHP